MLRAALNAHHAKHAAVEEKIQGRIKSKSGSACQAIFNIRRGIPLQVADL